jgi:hypothetical protein
MMKDRIYIHSSSCISAQETFSNPQWYNSIRNPENDLYRCAEPDYRDFIDSAALRRMNRVQKFGLCTALDALQKINNRAVDAIIVATGWGCIDSTYRFLERLFDQRELPVNPAVFIQSTHNTIAAQTAIYLKSRVYNNTVTDNRLPFELAMDNALLCLQDDGFENVLLGACDETTPQLIDIFNKISKFGRMKSYGEGAACFVLSKEKENSIAEIKYFNSVSKENVRETVGNLSKEYSIDYVFTSGKRNFPKNIPQILYTDYFGDFPTSAACGLWLAVDCLNSNNPAIRRPENILLLSENKQGTTFVTVTGRG